jgi:hypothetical protein
VLVRCSLLTLLWVLVLCTGVQGFCNSTIIVQQQAHTPPVGVAGSSSRRAEPLAAILVPALVGGAVLAVLLGWLIWRCCLLRNAHEDEGHHHKLLQQKGEVLLVAHGSKSTSNSDAHQARPEEHQEQVDSGSPGSCRTDPAGTSPSAPTHAIESLDIEQALPQQHNKGSRRGSRSRRASGRSQGEPFRRARSRSLGLGLAEGLLQLLPSSSVWSRSSRGAEGGSGRGQRVSGETSCPGSSDHATLETECKTVASHHGELTSRRGLGRVELGQVYGMFLGWCLKKCRLRLGLCTM